jgi:hypothetical protein
MNPPKYIRRGNNHWRVIIRKNKIGICNRQFSFHKYGGVKLALDAAIETRDSVLKKYGLLNNLNFIKAPDQYKTSRKNQPVIGVYFTKVIYKRKDKPHVRANWTTHSFVNEKEVKKSFAINKYGYEQAFLKACEVRYRHSGTLRVINVDMLPCTPTVPYVIV